MEQWMHIGEHHSAMRIQKPVMAKGHAANEHWLDRLVVVVKLQLESITAILVHTLELAADQLLVLA